MIDDPQIYWNAVCDLPGNFGRFHILTGIFQMG